MAKEMNLERLTFKTCPERGQHFRSATTLAQKYCSVDCREKARTQKEEYGRRSEHRQMRIL